MGPLGLRPSVCGCSHPPPLGVVGGNSPCAQVSGSGPKVGVAFGDSGRRPELRPSACPRRLSEPVAGRPPRFAGTPGPMASRWQEAVPPPHVPACMARPARSAGTPASPLPRERCDGLAARLRWGPPTGWRPCRPTGLPPTDPKTPRLHGPARAHVPPSRTSGSFPVPDRLPQSLQAIGSDAETKSEDFASEARGESPGPPPGPPAQRQAGVRAHRLSKAQLALD
jgi:hypothetical protein